MLIFFTINRDHFGIDGSSPCTTDYVQFFSGDTSITQQICSTQVPTRMIIAGAATGRVIFKGSNNNDRPSGLAGVKVTYRIV